MRHADARQRLEQLYGLAQAFQLCAAVRTLLQVCVYACSLSRWRLVIEVGGQLLCLDMAPG